MAKASAQAAAATEAPPKKGKKLLIIVLALVMVVLVAVAGVVVLLLNKNKGGEEAHETETSRVDLSKPPTFLPLDPFTVNLAPDEGNHYLQVVVALRVADAQMAETLKGFMPEIRHRVNLLLASKLPSELATMEGREDLAEEIREEANYVLGYEPPKRGKRGESDSGAPIQAVLFNSFIIQ